MDTYSGIVGMGAGVVAGFDKIGKAKFRVFNELRIGGLNGAPALDAHVHVEVGSPEAADINIAGVASAAVVVPAEIFNNWREAEELLLFVTNNRIVLFAPFCGVAEKCQHRPLEGLGQSDLCFLRATRAVSRGTGGRSTVLPLLGPIFASFSGQLAASESSFV